MGKQTEKVAILIFDDVEILDFCGPFEVFSVAGKEVGEKHFQVFTVAEKLSPVRTANGLSVNPDHDLEGCPRADVLVVPGGWGSRAAMKKPTDSGLAEGALRKGRDRALGLHRGPDPGPGRAFGRAGRDHLSQVL